MQDAELCGALIDLADDFARAASETAAWTAVTRHARSVLGARDAFLYQRGRLPDYVAFEPIYGSSDAPANEFRLVLPLSGRGSVCREEAERPISPYHPLFVALGDGAANSVVFTQVSEEQLLLLTFDARDSCMDRGRWAVLDMLAAQAGSACERIRSARRLAELSLRDDVTGLANRRLAQIILEHSFASSLRGEALSVVSIRAQANAPSGAPDALLAERLRPHIREADLFARLDEGLFLVVLHACEADGAAHFLERVQAELDGLPVQCTVAQPERTCASADELLESVLRQAGSTFN